MRTGPNDFRYKSRGVELTGWHAQIAAHAIAALKEGRANEPLDHLLS